MAASHRGLSLRRQRFARITLWALILTLAFGLRVAPIASGLPYLGYVDEGHSLHNVTRMLQEGTLDTGFYNYPALTGELIAGAALAYAPIYRQVHGRSLWSDLTPARHEGTVAYYDFVSPPEIIIPARAVVLLLSVGTVALAGVLASSIAGARAGLLALILTALCPALVSRGAIVIVDTVATFFALATLFLCRRLQLRAQGDHAAALWRSALFAGIGAGLAFASKYTVAAVFIAVLVTILLLPQAAWMKVRLSLIGTLGFVAGSVAAMPALVLHPGKIAETVGNVARFYNVLSSDMGYLAAAFSPAELGVPLVGLGIVGLVFLAWRQGETRAIVAGWLLFAALLIGTLIGSSFQPFRNLLPLAPLACISAACLIARAHLAFANPRGRRSVYRFVAPLLALVATTSLAIPTWHFVQERRALVDTRTAALRWLQAHARPNERILIIEELAIAPVECKRLGASVTVISWFEACAALERESFDYVVGSDFNLQFASDPKAWADYRDRWTTATANFAPAVTFGRVPCYLFPGVWRTNDERIVILKRPAE
jgi:Dolichyl-phosphate-mannose-protein mannosyltransferase